MSNNNKQHLWIPDEEVVRVNKELRAKSAPRNIPYLEHGQKLSRSLETIRESISQVSVDNSLRHSDLLVFKVELLEGEKIKHKQNIFTSTGMEIKAVKDERSAVVTTSNRRFTDLESRVNHYRNTGSNRTYFDYVGDFLPFLGSEKNSRELKRTVSAVNIPETLDLQLMLLPNLGGDIYEPAVDELLNKIARLEGAVQQQPYFLSDNTPVIRAIIPSTCLSSFENDMAVYRIEETDFFSGLASDSDSSDLGAIVIDPNLNLDALPIVAVLDTGVNFPLNLAPLVVQNWAYNRPNIGDANHGTQVACGVAFRYLNSQLPGGVVSPRARIVDCNILENDVPINELIPRVQAAVATFSDYVKIYNLSANANSPIEGDEMSILGYELDALQLKQDVQFVIPSGNHTLWRTESSLANILDDDDSRISSPADSLLSIVVGAAVSTDHQGSLSKRNDITPYSRRGPGFKGLLKPDLTAYAGTMVKVGSNNYIIPPDDCSLLLCSNGRMAPNAGTSFSCPIVAGDFAEILGIIPDANLLLSKALLYHNAQPLWDEETLTDDEAAFNHCLYGRGLSSTDLSKFSSASKVNFVRAGALNKVTKERVTIFMPSVLAAQKGRNTAKVSVTCLSKPPVDKSKGTEYLGAYIRASLKKRHVTGNGLADVNLKIKEGRQKWDTSWQFSKIFSDFQSGDWQVWLELFSQWDDERVDVPYALVVTIEDLSGTLDIYNEIELLNRYRPLNSIRVRARA